MARGRLDCAHPAEFDARFVTLGQPGVSTRNAEQGMLSMAFAPDYAVSGLFYVVFTDADEDLQLVEYRRSATDEDVADPSTRRTVLSIAKSQPTHNGGQLQFGPDRLLYLSVGDGGCCGDRNNDAQRLDSLLGKILWIDPNLAGSSKPYAVPSSNPFVSRRGARPEVDAYGLRNPYRFSFDRQTGEMAIADVGDVAPKGDEEIDFLAKGAARGANFGWNVFEAGGPFARGRRPGPCAPPSPTPAPARPARSSAATSCATRETPRWKAATYTATAAPGGSPRSSSPPAPARATRSSGASSRPRRSARTHWAGST